MNLAKVKLLKEQPNHYEMHDGAAPFKVAKAGLSDAMHAKIKSMGAPPQKFDQGGTVLDVPPPPGAPLSPSDFGPSIPADATVSLPPPEDLRALPQPKPTQTQLDAARDAHMPMVVGAQRAPDMNTDDMHLIQNPDGTYTPRTGLMALDQPLPKSLRATGAQAATPAAAPQTPASPGVDTSAGLSEYKTSTKQKQAATTEQGQMLAQQAREQADAAATFQNQMMKNQLDSQELTRRSHQDAQDAVANYKQNMQQMLNTDVTLDPDRFWASRSTGQKIFAGIGMALGAFSPDGVNKAAEIIRNAQKQDLDIQRDQLASKLKKGQIGMEGARTLAEMGHQTFQDDMAGQSAAQAAAAAVTKATTEKIAAKYGSPLAINNAKLLTAQLGSDEGKFLNDAASRRAEVSLRQRTADLEAQKVQLQLTQAGRQETLADNALTRDVGDWASHHGDLMGKAKQDSETQVATDLLNSRGQRINNEGIESAKKELGGMVDWARWNTDPAYKNERSARLLEYMKRARAANPRTGKSEAYSDLAQ